MVKKEEQLKEQQAAEAAAQAAANTPSATPNQDKWRENMRAKYPDAADDEALYEASMRGYDEEHDFAKQQREDIDAFTNSIKDYPELASFYSEAAQGNIGAAILNIGALVDAYRNGEIDDAKYKEQVAARKKADEDAAAAKETEQAELAEQNRIFEEWCAKKGYDPEEWMEKANEALFSPMISRKMAEKQFDAIDKMINYDAAVEAAEVRGRNANIQEQRRSVPKTSAPAGGAGIGAGVETGGGDIFSEIANSEKRQRDKNKAQ